MGKVISVTPLDLPDIFSGEEAMSNNKHNRHAYDTELWELEYAGPRYLSGAVEELLVKRYVGLLKAIISYEQSPRYDCPVNLPHGPWYWYRLEHHVRIEFKARDLEVPQITSLPNSCAFPRPVSDKIPNGEKVLFKYTDRKWAFQLREEGKLRINPAQTYLGEANNVAQQDDELRKTAFIPGRTARITWPDGTETKPIGDIMHTVSGPEYHQTSFSTVWDDAMFREFGKDACVFVNDAPEFLRRIEAAGKSHYPGWYFMDNPIQYFDPYLRGRNEFFDNAMSKDIRYAYQREYRIFWSRMQSQQIDEAQDLELGDCRDIIEVFDSDGRVLVV